MDGEQGIEPLAAAEIIATKLWCMSISEVNALKDPYLRLILNSNSTCTQAWTQN